MESARIVIGFDGTSASERAIREAARLLGPRRALVVVVWEAGRAFELATLQGAGMQIPPAALDVRVASEVDNAMYEQAQQTAQKGAALARESGFDAEGLAVADEITVAETLVRVAQEHHAPAIVVGAHGQGRLSELFLGSTARAVVKHAHCPVVVVRGHD